LIILKYTFINHKEEPHLSEVEIFISPSIFMYKLMLQKNVAVALQLKNQQFSTEVAQTGNSRSGINCGLI